MEVVRDQHPQSPMVFAEPFSPGERGSRDATEVDRVSEEDLSDMWEVGEEMV